ncbi:MAG: radical SAM protein [Oscillospiraceae bacterium]|nr:radical SAM protein [Oscillospiraceae bacterium]
MICTICPRRCGGIRTEQRGTGICKMPALPVVARASLHPWEEPCISGTRGSGTVFFSGCALRCGFCQNEPISLGGFGKPISVSRLREIFEELVRQGATNINLVTPTQFALPIFEALRAPLPVPVVWNSGGYDSVSALRLLEGKIQIYLPDFKYADPELARLCSGAEDYFAVAKAAVSEMVRQTGPCVLDGNGLLRRGVLIRHLMLPGKLQNTKAVIDFVANAFPPGAVWFSLMSQYVPMDGARSWGWAAGLLRESIMRPGTTL